MEGRKTGRREGKIRIKEKAKSEKPKRTLNERLGFKFKSTFDIIRAAEEGRLAEKVMMTVPDCRKAGIRKDGRLRREMFFLFNGE